ncbi:MAG: DUF1559 family PulG-like putative transporter [Armatimonadota bacterium]
MRKGFTLIELLVVIAIIAILAAILFPVFAKAREKARQSSCLSNTKQISLAVLQYSQDYDERFPATYTTPATPPGNQLWAMNIMPYCKNAQVFDCPSNSFKWNGLWSETMSYGYSMLFEGNPLPMGTIAKPAETILLGDGDNFRLRPVNAWIAYGSGRQIQPRHNEMANFAFCDGHSKAMRKNVAEVTGLTEDGTTLATVEAQHLLFNQY